MLCSELASHKEAIKYNGVLARQRQDKRNMYGQREKHRKTNRQWQSKLFFTHRHLERCVCGANRCHCSCSVCHLIWCFNLFTRSPFHEGKKREKSCQRKWRPCSSWQPCNVHSSDFHLLLETCVLIVHRHEKECTAFSKKNLILKLTGLQHWRLYYWQSQCNHWLRLFHNSLLGCPRCKMGLNLIITLNI